MLFFYIPILVANTVGHTMKNPVLSFYSLVYDSATSLSLHALPLAAMRGLLTEVASLSEPWL